MTSFRAWAKALALAAWASAPAAAQTPAAAPARPVPIFLAFGGYGSCLYDTVPRQSQVAPIAVRVADEARRRGYPARHVVHSCFHMTSRPQQEYVTYTIDGSGERTATVPDFLRYVRANLQAWDAGRNPVFVVGHSHGGWLAMRLASSYDVGPGEAAPFASLVTLDAINYELCNAEKQRRAMADGLNSNATYGCNHFNATFSLPRVGRQVGEWLNYYQDRCTFLHGEAFAGARNQRVTTRPAFSNENLNGLEELIRTGLPGVDPGRYNFREFLSRVFQDHDDKNFLYHTAITSAVQDQVIRAWQARL